MELVTMSLREVEAYTPGPNEACLAIHFADGSDQPELREGWQDILRVGFDDCTPDRVAAGLPNAAQDITVSQADAIARFAADAVHHGRDRLVVSCFAGVSRSVAVAWALQAELRLAYTPGRRWTNRPVYLAVREAVRRVTVAEAPPGP